MGTPREVAAAFVELPGSGVVELSAFHMEEVGDEDW